MKTLEATVSAWGKSTAIRIPTALVKRSGISVGQTVRLDSTGDGVITIRAVRERPDQADVSWGKPVGTEAW